MHKRGEEESTCRVEMIYDRVKVMVCKMIETFYGARFGDFGVVLMKTWKSGLLVGSEQNELLEVEQIPP